MVSLENYVYSFGLGLVGGSASLNVAWIAGPATPALYLVLDKVVGFDFVDDERESRHFEYLDS